MSKINISFTISDSYAHHLAVTLCSILSNAKTNYDFNIYVLHGGDVIEYNKKRIEMLKNIRDFNIKIKSI